MNNVAELLRRVSFRINVLREAKRRFSAELSPDFSLFRYLRDDELGLSAIFADLLDPHGSHGQGGLFLDLFIKRLEGEHAWMKPSLDWRVVTEKQAHGQRRIDIYMESMAGLIGIENKPWAADQDRQLADYADFLEKQAAGRPWMLIYLGNSSPAQNSIGADQMDALRRDGRMALLSFYQIVGWLSDCAAHSRSLVVRVFLEELAKFVRTDINEEMDMSEAGEVVAEVRKSRESIEAAFAIGNALKAVKKSLLVDFRGRLEAMSIDHGFKVQWDSGMDEDWPCCSGFGLVLSEGDSKYLRIEFGASGLRSMYWGIMRQSGQVEKDDEIWGSIHDVMRIFGNGRRSDWWPWYSMVPDSYFGQEYRSWDVSSAPWVGMSEGGLAPRIIDLAVQVKMAFLGSGKQDLLK